MDIAQRPLARLLNQKVEIQRLAQTGSTDKESYQTHLSNIDANIQPLDDRYGEDFDGNFGKDYLMFTALIDVQEQDKVIDEDGTEYRVVGVERFFESEEHGHIELIIRRFYD